MVMFGGPLMNFLLALVVFFIAGLIQGFPNYAETKVTFAGMDESNPTPAYAAGLRSGDVIIELRAGELYVETQEWSDISGFMDQYTEAGLATTIEATYLRDGVKNTVLIEPNIMMYNIYAIGKFDEWGIKITQLDKRDTKGMADIKELQIGDIITKINGVNHLELAKMYRELADFSGEDPERKSDPGDY